MLMNTSVNAHPDILADIVRLKKMSAYQRHAQREPHVWTRYVSYCQKSLVMADAEFLMCRTQCKFPWHYNLSLFTFNAFFSVYLDYLTL